MKAKFSLGEIHKKYSLNQKICAILNLDVWTLNDITTGHNRNDLIEIDSHQAKQIGIPDNEFFMRLN